ncbi:MAG: hypothetical protein LLG20_18620 [Acidobacteriales bacterium]|nr:hypothetical protein [Terriglobales bacterium]
MPYTRPQVRMIVETAIRNTYPPCADTDSRVEELRKAADRVMEAVEERDARRVKVMVKGAGR